MVDLMHELEDALQAESAPGTQDGAKGHTYRVPVQAPCGAQWRRLAARCESCRLACVYRCDIRAVCRGMAGRKLPAGGARMTEVVGGARVVGAELGQAHVEVAAG